MKKSEYLDLAYELNRLAAAYEKGTPLVSDAEYDAMYSELLRIEAEKPKWVGPDSPSQKVGADVPTVKVKTRHPYRLLSLANAYDIGELRDWYRATGNPSAELAVSWKVDGLSLVLTYEQGKLVYAATRGNGEEGESVLRAVHYIANLPTDLTWDLGRGVPDVLHLRGEVYMPREAFKEYNEAAVLRGAAPLANARNAAAGALMGNDPEEVKARKLQFILHDVVDESGRLGDTWSVAMHALSSAFLTTYTRVVSAEYLDNATGLDVAETLRSSLPYEVDGLVFALDDFYSRTLLGATHKYPRWAVAYKFAPEECRTTLRAITLQTGRTGVITPVAELSPVLVGGGVVSRATLHNFAEIQAKDLCIGDTVVVRRAGEVIPEVVGPIVALRNGQEQPFTFGTECPSCHTKLHVTASSHMCPNTKCAGRKLAQIEWFVSKTAMDVKGLGREILKELLRMFPELRPLDLYTLPREEWIHATNSKRVADKIMRELEESKSRPVHRLLVGLGVAGVGEALAKTLIATFGSLEGIMSATRGELSAVSGVGERKAEAIYTYFQDGCAIEEVCSAQQLGIGAAAPIKVQGHLAGKSFVITGTLKVPRQQMQQQLEDAGAMVSSGVSRRTSFLIAGDGGGSKLEAAAKHGVPVLTEEEAIDMVRKSG